MIIMNECILHFQPLLLEVVEFLLLVNANNKNARNHVGRTPLHLAAANGDLELCKFLMEKGTNPDALMLSKVIWIP